MISFRNVCKSYGKSQALNDVSFIIDDNDFVLFEGTNGSGKTTTIKLLLGLIKLGKNDQGEIINSFNRISYIPEHLCLPPYITGEEFIKDLIKFIGSEVDYIPLFEELKLDPLAKICSYSKGMRQKLGIIQALVTSRELVVLDEPLSGLDDSARIKAVALLSRLKGKKTVIISTHFPKLFKKIPNKKFVFDGGHLV